MIMNKQSNSYTILYIIVLVLVVGSALASRKTPTQTRNARYALRFMS